MSTRKWTEGHTRQGLTAAFATSSLNKAPRSASVWLLPAFVAVMLLLYALPAISPASSMYVVNDGFNDDRGDPIAKFTISQYNIDPAIGTLATLSPQLVGEGSAPRGIAVSPDGKNAYVTHMTIGTESIDGNVSQYDIDPETRALTPKSPATVEAGNYPFNDPFGIAVSPDGTSVYVTNYFLGTVSQYDVDPATGELSSKDPPTAPAGEAGARPNAVAVSPDGKSAYVTDENDDNVLQYDIDPATGALTPKSPAAVTTFGTLEGIAVSPDGTSVYVTNSSGSAFSVSGVYQYDVDAATGELLLKDPPIVPMSGTPWAVTVSPDGKSAYVTAFSGSSVSQYDIDPATGELSSKDPPTAPAGARPRAVAVSPDGKSAYVTNEADDNVSQYNIDPVTGALTPKSPATVSAGMNPQDLAIVPGKSPDPGPGSRPSVLDQPVSCIKNLYKNRLEVPREVRLTDLVKGKGVKIKASASKESSGRVKVEITGRNARHFKVFGKRSGSNGKTLVSAKIEVGKEPKDFYLVARGKARKLIKRALRLKRVPKRTKLKVSLTTQSLTNSRLKRLNSQTVRALRRGKVKRTGTYVKIRKVVDRSQCGEPLTAKIEGPRQIKLTALTTRRGKSGSGVKIKVSCSEDCTAKVGLRMWGRYEVGLKFRRPGQKKNRLLSSRKVDLKAGEEKTLRLKGVSSKKLRRLLARGANKRRYKRIKLKYSVEARTDDGESDAGTGTLRVRLRFG